MRVEIPLPWVVIIARVIPEAAMIPLVRHRITRHTSRSHAKHRHPWIHRLDRPPPTIVRRRATHPYQHHHANSH